MEHTDLDEPEDIAAVVEEAPFDQPDYFIDDEAAPIYDEMEEALINAPIEATHVDQYTPLYTYQVLTGFDAAMYNNQQQYRQFNGDIIPDQDPFRNNLTGARHCALKYERHHPPSLQQLGHLANYIGQHVTISITNIWKHFHEPVTYLCKNINGTPTMRAIAGHQETHLKRRGYPTSRKFKVNDFQRYVWYREEGGQRLYRPTDEGTELYYYGLPLVRYYAAGHWYNDYEYIRPSIHSFRDPEYAEWFQSFIADTPYNSDHPISNIDEAVRTWVDFRRHTEGCLPEHSRSYTSYLRRTRNDDRSLLSDDRPERAVALATFETVLHRITRKIRGDDLRELTPVENADRLEEMVEMALSALPTSSRLLLGILEAMDDAFLYDNTELSPFTRDIRSPDMRPYEHPERSGTVAHLGRPAQLDLPPLREHYENLYPIPSFDSPQGHPFPYACQTFYPDIQGIYAVHPPFFPDARTIATAIESSIAEELLYVPQHVLQGAVLRHPMTQRYRPLTPMWGGIPFGPIDENARDPHYERLADKYIEEALESIHHRPLSNNAFPHYLDQLSNSDVDFLTNEIAVAPQYRRLFGRATHNSNDHKYGYYHHQMRPDLIIDPDTLQNQSTAPNRTSMLFTQRATSSRFTPLQHKIRVRQHKLRTSMHAILDSGAQVSTMSASLAEQSPLTHNLRPAPHGTAVMYGNGTMQRVDKLIDVGTYDFQLTPDKCAATLVSVDQIVKSGHDVTFSNHQTVIADVNNGYRLRYSRNPSSREWKIPIEAMAQISELRTKHPLNN